MIIRYADMWRDQDKGFERFVKDNYLRYEGKLKEEQLAELENHLRDNLYVDARSICDYVLNSYGISYSESGMTKVLHRLSFVYKYTKSVPGKAEESAQVEFLEETLPELLQEESDGEAVIYYADGCHPTHGHAKRGRAAMDQIGIIGQANGTLIHDRLSSYMSYDHVEYGLCNAHILRELKSIEQNQQLEWATQIKKKMIQSKQNKVQEDLDNCLAKRIKLKYESILRAQRPYYQERERQLKIEKPSGPIRRNKDHKLFLALWKHRKAILLFMYHNSVPFDNNQAERDLRMFKVKMKISNHFLSEQWLNVHATIRSFISTAQKKNLDIFDCLLNAHLDPKSSAKVGV